MTNTALVYLLALVDGLICNCLVWIKVYEKGIEFMANPSAVLEAGNCAHIKIVNDVIKRDVSLNADYAALLADIY